MPEAGFAQTYRQARQLFLSAAGAAGATVQTYAHPLPGAEGEALAMDVARSGGFDAPALLVVSSACHGVEGFAGSAVQNALLAEAALRADAQAAGVALLLIHALNPHGFSHQRRVTHEGVDLNRNWVDFTQPLPANPGYDAIAQLLLPERWPPGPEVQAGLQAYAAAHGPRALQQAVSGGQYRHPQGLFYGGAAPTWSHLTLRRVLRQHGRGCRRLAWIDLHTGLGPSGHGERILAARPDPATVQRARAWWGADGGRVTALHDGSSSSSELEGMMWQAAYDECPQAEFTGIALEYGTLPLEVTLAALRADHWHAAHPEAPAEGREQARRAMRAAFYVETPEWQQQVLAQGLAAVRLAVAGLSGA
ncbi:MAG: M14 family metallopeptidase [Burkholderiales bacterium]|nr:M14 family metallopeptidase [Burkholderiales bacterium]